MAEVINIEMADQAGLDGSEFWICAGLCDECLFTPNRIVSPERAEQIIQDCLANDNWFVCHKFSFQGRKVCCRGFWNRHRKDVYPLRLAQIFYDEIKFVSPPGSIFAGNCPECNDSGECGYCEGLGYDPDAEGYQPCPDCVGKRVCRCRRESPGETWRIGPEWGEWQISREEESDEKQIR